MSQCQTGKRVIIGSFHPRQEWLERALVATRSSFPAKMFPDHHQLRVIILPVIQARRARFLVQRRFTK